MGDADINTLMMEQYLALTRGNQAPGVVKLKIGGNVNLEIKSQFMRELREDTFSRNKNDNAYEHIERILDIVSLFNIPGVTHDAVMLRIFPITLTRAAKRWVDRLSLGTINTWDLLKNTFIQRMEDPNITMEEYVRLEEEKAQRRRKVFNWETAKYGKIFYDEDIHDLRSVETEFPAIAFNDGVSSEKTLSYEPTVSSINDEIDFRISFDDSDDEDYTYTYADIADFEARLARIYRREVHMVQVFDFGGLSDLMADGLSARMLMEHKVVQGVSLFTSWAWRRLFEIRGRWWSQETFELEVVYFGLGITYRGGDRRDISTDGDFLGPPPSYTLIRDPVLRLCHRMITYSIASRSQALEKFVARLVKHFGLLTAEILQGLTVITPALPIIDMVELVRLQICMEIDDTWAWVALGPERQPDATVGALEAAEDAPVDDEGGQAVLAPIQAPQPPPPPPIDSRTMLQRMARLEEDVREICGVLTEQGEVIDAMACDFSRFSTWAVTSLARMMDRAGVTYTSYSETPREYQRSRVRRKTDEANTSAA
ncbi:hypothetical protein Tco_0928630 [Tanacetum coccineum]